MSGGEHDPTDPYTFSTIAIIFPMISFIVFNVTFCAFNIDLKKLTKMES